MENNPTCPRCRGSGTVFMSDGPDDYLEDFCSCEIGQRQLNEAIKELEDNMVAQFEKNLNK